MVDANSYTNGNNILSYSQGKSWWKYTALSIQWIVWVQKQLSRSQKWQLMARVDSFNVLEWNFARNLQRYGKFEDYT